MNKSEKIKNAIDASIDELTEQLHADRKNGFSYDCIYEADIQSVLYNIINKKLGADQKNNDIVIWHHSKNTDPLRGNTVLAHCQTAVPQINEVTKRKSRQHLDIGFWDYDYLDEKLDYTDKIAAVGIEIKYSFEMRCKRNIDVNIAPEKIGGILEDYWSDIKKLMSPKRYTRMNADGNKSEKVIEKTLKAGYALWFVPCFEESTVDDTCNYLKKWIGTRFKSGTTKLTLVIVSKSPVARKYENKKWYKWDKGNWQMLTH